MKRTCHGCWALPISDFGCNLGYANKYSTDNSGKVQPSEECPKPKTIKELFKAKHKKRERGKV